MKHTDNTCMDPHGFGITMGWRWMMVKMTDADIPLHEVVVMATSSLPIPPLDAFWRLGFSVLDGFLGSLGV